MPNHTTNYQLVKPTGAEAVDIDVINGNMDIIDTNMKRIDNRLDQDVKTTSNVTFNQLSANIVRGAVWSANDYAELYKKADVLEDIRPGHVIALRGGGGYGKSTSPHCSLVVGVCSDSYAHIIGGDEDESKNATGYIPVALAGRVKVFCKGKAEPGDRLVSSSVPGVAFVPSNPWPGTIIGKALERKKTDGIGLIYMQVFLA